MSKTIPLTQGKVAIVDDADYERFSKIKWQALWNLGTQSFYAARRASIAERLLGAPKTIYMHREVNRTPKGKQTDHISHDTLDNTRGNLRTATTAENGQNQGKHKDNTSGYKGVTLDKQRQKWKAQIQVNGKHKNIGYFDDPEDAARAYQTAAKELHGEFARTE